MVREKIAVHCHCHVTAHARGVPFGTLFPVQKVIVIIKLGLFAVAPCNKSLGLPPR